MDKLPPPKELVDRLAFPGSDAPPDRKAEWFEAWRGMNNAEKWAVLEEHHAARDQGASVIEAAALRDLDAMAHRASALTGIAAGAAVAVTWLACWWGYKALPARRARNAHATN